MIPKFHKNLKLFNKYQYFSSQLTLRFNRYFRRSHEKAEKE